MRPSAPSRTTPRTAVRARARTVSPARSLLLVAAASLVGVPLLVAPGASAAAPRVTWSDRSVVAGKPMTATVAPASVDGAAAVLQRRFPDAPWRVADSTPRVTTGGLVLDVPTSQYGSFRYRVVALQRDTVVSATDAVKVTVAPPYSPAGAASSHKFMSSPRWLWDSCRGPITWKFSTGSAPSGALKQVKGAFARVHAATGLDFRYLGTTDVAPDPGGAPDSGADVVIGWLGQRAFSDQYGDAVGMGGARYFTNHRLANGDRVNRASQGGVALNARYNDDLGNGFGTGFTWGEVLMHELGHVVGLDHVGSTKQMMYPSITRGAARFGAGDLNGFRKVGDTFGCLVPDNARARTAQPRVSISH